MIVGPMNVSAIFNVAVAGQTTTQMLANGSTQVDSLFASGKENIVIVLEGTNDLGMLQDATAVYDNLIAYCNARRAAGFKVVIGTIPPSIFFSGTQETRRQTVNTNLRANWATFADALADFAADSRLSNNLNSTYYTDGTHWTQAGCQAAAEIVAMALITL